jgi:hypothetical protein
MWLHHKIEEKKSPGEYQGCKKTTCLTRTNVNQEIRIASCSESLISVLLEIITKHHFLWPWP